MITFFNKLGNSWVAKLILGVLALSMLAFWGLGGLANVSSYNATNDVVQVGKKGISIQRLNNAFESARKGLSQLAGNSYLSPSKAIEMGLLDQVVQQEVAVAVQESLNDELGLTASNAAISKYIEKNPVFADNTGKFDKNLFYAYLMQANLSETQLAHKLKKELAFKHLQDSIQGLGYAPKAMIEALNQYKNEKRDATALVIRPENITITEKPTDEDLTNYYEAYSEEFMNPEYRSLTVAVLTPEMMMNRVSVSQEDIDFVYEDEKDKYNKPEERDIYQMFFKTEDEAKAVREIVTVDNFETTATEKTPQSAEDTHFGWTTRNQLMEELGEPAFKTDKNSIVGPIQSQAGWHILWIKDIKKAEIVSADKVKEEIKKKLALDKTYEAVEELSRQLEDELGAGASLTAASEKLNIEVVPVKEVAITGTLSSGTDLDESMNNKELLQNVFTLQKGDVSGLIQNENGYIIAQVDDIIPVGVKSFDSVKDEVKEIWIKEQQEKAFSDIVNQLNDKAKKANALADLKDDNGGSFEIVDLKDITRSQNVTEVSNAVVETIFQQDIGKENATTTQLNNLSVITVVHKINQPESEMISDELKAETIRETGNALSTAVLQDYTTGLGIKVNQQMLNNLMSQYRTQE